VQLTAYVVRRATFSDCGLYRYHLYRRWSWDRPVLGGILLNPSTADAVRDDPTTRVMMGFADRWGYGGWWPCNLFAYRGTYPDGLVGLDDPVGSGNDVALSYMFSRVDDVLVAWGKNAERIRPGRARSVAETAERHGVRLWCIGQNGDGSPRFPRAVPRETSPSRFYSESLPRYTRDS